MKIRRCTTRPKATLDMEDILKKFLAADSAGVTLPIFYAKDLCRLPAGRGGSSMAGTILSKLRKVSQKVESIARLSSQSKTAGFRKDIPSYDGGYARAVDMIPVHDTVRPTSGVECGSISTTEEDRHCSLTKSDQNTAVKATANSSTIQSTNQASSVIAVKDADPECSWAEMVGSGSNSDRMDDGFKVVLYKKRGIPCGLDVPEFRGKPPQTKPKVIKGTRIENAPIKGVPRRKTITAVYVGRCDPTTTKNDMATFLSGLGIKDSEVEALKARSPLYASFKILAPTGHTKLLLSPDTWGENIEVRRWKGTNRSPQTEKKKVESSEPSVLSPSPPRRHELVSLSGACLDESANSAVPQDEMT